MRLSVVVLVVILSHAAINAVRSARILAIVPTPSYSHQVAFHPIWKELSKKHDVVTVTTHLIKDFNSPNLTQIDLSALNRNSILEALEEDMIQIKNDLGRKFKIMAEIIKTTVSYFLEHPYLANIIKNPESEHFNMVIIEAIYVSVYPIAELLHCPLVGALSIDAPISMHSSLGNPANPLVYPEVMLPYYGEFNFKQRLMTAFFFFYLHYVGMFQFGPLSEQLLEKYFNTTTTISELENKYDLLLINSNPIMHGNRPLGPKTVSFGGGSHIDPLKPLPKDIADFLNSAPEGVIYFSLGSSVKSKRIKDSLRRTILETFKELPYKVLWKFEADELEGKPDNVKIVKWLPQQDVLRHPNVKLFITQGGLQSLDESIYSYVPMVVLPFMGDQLSNGLRITSKGMGLNLDPETLTKETFKKAVLEVFENDTYRNTVRKLVDLAKDQPMTGVERAVWWLEYVIRHNGTEHLAYEGRNLPTYQYYFLDIIGFFLLILIAIIILTVFLLKKICKFFRSTKREKSKLN